MGKKGLGERRRGDQNQAEQYCPEWNHRCIRRVESLAFHGTESQKPFGSVATIRRMPAAFCQQGCLPKAQINRTMIPPKIIYWVGIWHIPKNGRGSSLPEAGVFAARLKPLKTR